MIRCIQQTKLIVNIFLSRISWVFILLLIGSCKESNENEISFNKDVRPILNDKCLRCHGGVKTSGGFSLLFEKDAFEKTESGKFAIIRGNHEKSEFYKRLITKNKELRMPYESPELSQKEIDIIAKWIDQGAKWEKHWAYVPPKKNIVSPSVIDNGWSKNSIDNFVYAKLKEKSLIPSSEAGKNTLMRRLYLDLTGLPPTMKETKAYLEDSSSDSYEKLVDKLLQSPHFGERWASMWMDLARYADSKGFEKDSNREIWKYRDWIINSFNNDMPFDRFSIEQLAGDLLPHPIESQLIATAFHRNTLANDEGGTDNEQFRVASVLERVSTTYEVWQGTTMGCVQCHSHPYDPFRHKEFYESMAFFNNAADDDSYFEKPKLFTYSDKNKKEVKELLEYINTKLTGSDKKLANSNFLFKQKEDVLNYLGFRSTEAEAFDQSSPFIELDGSLNFLWQVQDSSWVKYNKVDLSKIKEIGFVASANSAYAGDISVHLDSLDGMELARVKIGTTQNSKIVNHGLKIREFKSRLNKTNGVHDIFLQFHKGDHYDGNLFFLDKIVYYETKPIMDSYDKEFKQKLKILDEVPAISTPIIKELTGDQARKTYVFDRGNWLNLGEKVDKGIPDIYGIPKSEEPSNRLEFAKWLVSEKNPLTARVVVNRFWEKIFGLGLVESMEEFGSQGNKPSHPGLLDYLSIRFMENHDWKMKPLIRDIVLSATYRQSSIMKNGEIQTDPNNKWLSRGPRIRLSAEQIRDEVLTVTGLLNRKIGGPSVLNSDVKVTGTIPDYVIQGDSALYRRSLYTFWKRVNPPMNMIIFDSPDRSACVSRRIRTNTPLQALNLLNDNTFFEASQTLAKQMLEVDDLPENQIKFGYYKVMGKELNEDKLKVLKELYDNALVHYQENIEDHKFSKTAVENVRKNKSKFATLTIVANTLLNMDEFIVKG